VQNGRSTRSRRGLNRPGGCRFFFLVFYFFSLLFYLFFSHCALMRWGGGGGGGHYNHVLTPQSISLVLYTLGQPLSSLAPEEYACGSPCIRAEARRYS